MRPRTLRARFAAWTALLVLGIVGALGGFVYARTSDGLHDSIDDGLVLDASQVIGELDVADGKLLIGEGLVDPPPGINLRDQGFAVRIVGPDGSVLQALGPYTNLPAPDGHSTASFATSRDAPTGDSIRVRSEPIVSDGVVVATVQVAQSLENVEETLSRLRLTLLFSAPVLAFCAAAGGWFLAARALRPIDRMTRKAAAISADDLGARLGSGGGDDEVGRLAATLDGMLERLDSSFQRERRLTADASHQLRTPVTAMQAILSVTAERDREPGEYRAALADLQVQADRLRTIADGLMRLARSESAPERTGVDLSEVVEDVCTSFQPLAGEKSLQLDMEIAPAVTVVGDGDALVGLVANLLDNAIKYTHAGAVAVRLRADGSEAMLEVADSGPGIPPAQREAVFDRFHRLDPTGPVPGAGLGLAIARDVAKAHGGLIAVASEAGHGTTFTVRLPLAR